MKFVLFAALFVTLSLAQWTVVDNDYATIAMGCSFQTDTDGWVAGSTASVTPILWHTNDSASTFEHAPSDMTRAVFLAIDMADADHGLAGGLGFFSLACGAVTSNGTWSKIEGLHDFFCAIQSVQAIDQSNFVMTGVWATLLDFDGNGILTSTDGGKKWDTRNWNQGTDARYASFLSSTTGFVAGGTFPTTSNNVKSFPYRVTRHIVHNGRELVVDPILTHNAAEGNFSGVIALTTDGGKNFKTVLNVTGQGLYFNEIYCTDVNTCWAAAEGVNMTNGQATAVLYATTDGGSSWNTQITFPGGSLVTVNMYNSTYGWCGGAALNDDSSSEGVAFVTTDGQTWTPSNELKGFYFMQISTVDETAAYAAGITSLGLSSLAKFSN